MKTQVYHIAEQQCRNMTIGSRILISLRMFVPQFISQIVEPLVARHDPSRDKAPGQHYIPVRPADLLELGIRSEIDEIFSSGVGRRTQDPSDYVVRQWRGRVGLFLKRHAAARTESAALIVYTREAFLADPQITDDDRLWLEPDTTHVLVTCLAYSAGPAPELTPDRFVANLAGGNNAYEPSTIASRMSSEFEELPNATGQDYFCAGIIRAIEMLQEEAKRVNEYDNEWCVVAD
jgi:hypothetical protein